LTRHAVRLRSLADKHWNVERELHISGFLADRL
jgi:hypothetical protein